MQPFSLRKPSCASSSTPSDLKNRAPLQLPDQRLELVDWHRLAEQIALVRHAAVLFEETQLRFVFHPLRSEKQGTPTTSRSAPRTRRLAPARRTDSPGTPCSRSL